MKAPDKIYLQVCGDCPGGYCKHCKFEDLEDNVTWSRDHIFPRDIEYVRKERVIDFLKKRMNTLPEPLNEYDLVLAQNLHTLIEEINEL